MKKKEFWIAKVLLSFLFMCSVQTIYAYDFEVDGIYYSVKSSKEQTCRVVQSTIKYVGDISIPEKVHYDAKTYDVVEINNFAFEDCNDLKSVIIPNSVTRIGNSAFRNCSGLISIEIPNSVTEIASYAFRGCSSLTTFTIPNSVTKIVNDMFYGCSSLTSITIPNSITEIGSYAFWGCSSLTSIRLPNSVTEIASYAFHNCSKLTSVEIPNSLTEIKSYVFNGCSGLTSITIPNSITKIGSHAFSGCSSLTDIIIPSSVIEIGSSAFYGCSSMASIEIPNTVTEIASNVFSGCSGLTNIKIPSSVIGIGNYAFSGCIGLTNITIPVSVVQIGSSAFSGCSELTDIYIPNSVTEIGKSAFEGCIGMKTITISSSVMEIPSSVFKNCSGLINIDIPNSVTKINNSAFYGCSSLTSIRLPNSVTEIASNAFYNCSGLTNLEIPSSVTKIDSYAFYNCSSLTSIELPNSVTEIGAYAFAGCGNIRSVTSYISEPFDIASTVFYFSGNLMSAILYVPMNSVDKYKSAKGWNKFKTIYSIPDHSVYDSDIVYYCYDSNMTAHVRAYQSKDLSENVCIKRQINYEGRNYSVEEISDYAFKDCKEIRSMEIPDGVKIIGEQAFYGCEQLSSVTIQKSINTIGASAFEGCNELKSITLLCTKIEKWFNGFNSITNVEIGNEVTEFESKALYDCNSITSVTSYIDSPYPIYQIFNEFVCANAILYVPLQSVEQYKTTEGWKNFKNIVPIAGNTLTMTVTDEHNNDITEKVNIVWYDKEGKQVGTGTSLGGVEGDAELYYSILLEEQLGRIYREVIMQKVVASNKPLTVQLTKIDKLTLHGKVASYNTDIARANVNLTQWLNGKYEYTDNIKTDANGEFTMEVYNDSTELVVSYDGYLDCKLLYRNFENGELGIINLKPVTGKIIVLTLTYQEAIREGEIPLVQNWYSDTRNIEYSVTNMTKGTDITDFAIQHGNIVLPAGVDVNDRIGVTLCSMNGKFGKASGEVIFTASDTAYIDLNLVAYGGVEVVYSQKNDDELLAMIYDTNDKLVVHSTFSIPHVTFMGLPSGNYTLVTMGYNGVIGAVSDISDLDVLGFVDEEDYVKTVFSVYDGIIGYVNIADVPELDASKVEYTSPNASYLPNKSQMIVGHHFITLTARVDFKTQYANNVSDVKLLVDIPDGCEFIENSVVTGTKALVHSLSGNQLSIKLSSEDVDSRIRFCITPMQVGTFTSTAYVTFDCGGEKIQPIGSAVFEATAGYISVPSKSNSTIIPVNGIVAPHAEVDIYDNDHLIGTANALGDGSWSKNCELYEPYNLTTHEIFAKYKTESGTTIKTASQKCFYEKTDSRVKSVLMTFYNGWLKRNVNVTFDFESGVTDCNSYMFYTATDITFIADLTTNDTTSIQDVTFYVHTSSKQVRTLKGFFDEKLGRWVAVGNFDSYNLPVNLNVSIASKETETLGDRDYLDDGIAAMEDAFKERQNEVEELKVILSDTNAELENEKLYQELEALLSNDDYDPAKADSLMSLILSHIPESDRQISEEEFQQMVANFDNDQKRFDEWFEQRMTVGRDSIYAAAMIDLDILNKELPTIPYSGQVSADGMSYGCTAEYISSINEDELLSQGYIPIGLTDGSRLFCKLTDNSFDCIDEKTMARYSFDYAEMAEARGGMRRASRIENLLQGFQNVILNLREGASLTQNYEDMDSQGQFILNLWGLIDAIYKTAYETINNRINGYFDVNLSLLDSEIAAAIERHNNWATMYKQKDFNWRLKNLGHMRQLEWNVARLQHERVAVARARMMCVNFFRQFPTNISNGIVRMNNGMRALGRIGGGLSVLLDVYDMGVDIQDFIREWKGWYDTWKILEMKKPCEGDKENLQSIIDGVRRDWIDVCLDYTGILYSKYNITLADCAQLLAGENPVLELGLYVGSVYAGLFTEIYKVVRIDNGEFVNRKSRHWENINKLKCVKEDKDDEKEDDGKNDYPSNNDDIPNNNDDQPNPPFKDVTPIHDPSGFVYEAVPTNRIEGVTASIYYDEGGSQLWDAADFSQVNPIVTDETGLYAWDVPQGNWQVRFEKSGYETTQTEWLPVPPPQLEINIPMSQAVAPQVVKARGTESGISLEFSKYMTPSTLEKNGRVSATVNGKNANGSIEMLNMEENPYNNKEYVSKVKFVPNAAFKTTDEVIITVKKEVESYANKQMEADFVQSVKIEPEIKDFQCDSLIVIDYQGSGMLEITMLPAAAVKGKVITIVSTSPTIATADTQVPIDDEGKAHVMVNGELPGSCSLHLQLDGTDVEKWVEVDVVMAETVVKTPKASKRSGSIVEAGYLLELTCNTKGATIYYTLDGSCPCDEQKRIKYVGPITLSVGQVTLKAMAVREGMEDSDIAVYEYTVESTSGIYAVQESHSVSAYNEDGCIIISGAKGADCRIYDLQGRELASRNRLDNTSRINVPLTDVYVISVLFGDGHVVTHKIFAK